MQNRYDVHPASMWDLCLLHCCWREYTYVEAKTRTGNQVEGVELCQVAEAIQKRYNEGLLYEA